MWMSSWFGSEKNISGVSKIVVQEFPVLVASQKHWTNLCPGKCLPRSKGVYRDYSTRVEHRNKKGHKKESRKDSFTWLLWPPAPDQVSPVWRETPSSISQQGPQHTSTTGSWDARLPAHTSTRQAPLPQSQVVSYSPRLIACLSTMDPASRPAPTDTGSPSVSVLGQSLWTQAPGPSQSWAVARGLKVQAGSQEPAPSQRQQLGLPSGPRHHGDLE